ncbi:MAG: hypothetical protein CMJ18_15045 [Phycisphaeraceae bacterium]|nr:hypothetical protein [Phycisphaeraceae bacterium]
MSSLDLQRIAVKCFARDGQAVEADALIGVFHRWIQRNSLPSFIPIDVADYSHVRQGPGVMLICHEGQFSVDEADGAVGVQYASKRGATGSTAERMTAVLRHAATAGRMLESEGDLGGLSFECRRMRWRVDDRLAAPNTDASMQALRPDLEQALAGAFGDADISLERVEGDRTGLTVDVTIGSDLDLNRLLGRLGGGS